MNKGDEDGARDMLLRAEKAERQRDRLREELHTQSDETEEIRDAIVNMHDRMQKARSRLELLQAQMRQGEARRAINKVMVGVKRGESSKRVRPRQRARRAPSFGGAVLSKARRRASGRPSAPPGRELRGGRRRGRPDGEAA